MTQESNHISRQTYPDEVSLQDVILSSARILKWLKKHWLGLAVCLCITLGPSLWWASQQEETYIAELSFMLNDDNNSNISAASSILSQLGISPQSGRYNVDKLLEIARSERIINKSLLEKRTIGSNTDFLANHLIERLALHEKWKKSDEALASFYFKHNQIDDFVKSEQTAIKRLYQLVVGPKHDRTNGLLKADYGSTDYIMSLRLSTPSDSLSIGVVESIYEELVGFYTTKSSEKNRSIYDLIQGKKDSLDQIIRDVAYDLGRMKDRREGSFKSSSSADIALLENKLAGLQILSEEVIKNLSRAEYALEANTPLIQLLDKPSYPLTPQKPSYLRITIIAAFLGFILFGLFCFFRAVLEQL